MKPRRVLFVDDEPGIRLTFPEILKRSGYEVRTAASVSEALSELTTHPFDILISDLNIGEPGDGFTVVSAMRRTQPDCINLILTGFPAFEDALSAIQRQVDDYLVKPAKVEQLVKMIEEKLRTKLPHHEPKPPARITSLIREHGDKIRTRVLEKMKKNEALASLPLSDDERVDHVPKMLEEMVNLLESAEPDTPTEQSLKSSVEHGKQRLREGYGISMLVADTSILDDVIYDLVREHLLMMDTSNLVIDLKRFNHALQMNLMYSIQAYWQECMGGATSKV